MAAKAASPRRIGPTRSLHLDLIGAESKVPAIGCSVLLLIVTFLVTSADSGTFVLSMMTTNGNLNHPSSAKVLWGTLVAIITAATLMAGSVDVARAMSTLGAIPFSAILILQIVSFLRCLRKDPSREKTAPKNEKPAEVTS